MSHVSPPPGSPAWQAPGSASGSSTGAVLGRSAAAGGGALVGGVLAVPIAGALFTFLFEVVGAGIMESMSSGALEDASGIEAILGAIFLPIAALMVAVMIVFALIAPVFLILPMAVITMALRLARAGLIMRTVGLTLVAVLVLAAALAMVANVTGLQVQRWAWFPVLATGGFLGRYAVEVRRPDRAGVPERVAIGPRWRRLALAWLVILLIGVAGAILLALGSASVQVSGPG